MEAIITAVRPTRTIRRPMLPDFSQLPAHPPFEAKVRALLLLRAAVAELEQKQAEGQGALCEVS